MSKNKHINTIFIKASHIFFCSYFYLIFIIAYDIVYYFVQSVTNEEVTQEELGGAKTHTSISGKTCGYIIYLYFILISHSNLFFTCC